MWKWKSKKAREIEAKYEAWHKEHEASLPPDIKKLLDELPSTPSTFYGLR